MKCSLLLVLIVLLLAGPLACGHDSPEHDFGNRRSGSKSETKPLDFPGIPLPARIEAESFERAHESDTEKDGDAQCESEVNEFVDVGASILASGGCLVGYSVGGEWLEWDIAVPEDGGWDFKLRVASQLSGRSVSISIDGNLRGTVTVPATDWLDFVVMDIDGVGLTEGTHVLRFTFDTGAVNLDYIEISRAGACEPACGRRTCGDDHCGGTCGTCGEDQFCNSADQCVGPFEIPVQKHGQLSVKEGQLRAEDGSPVQLRGVSTQWLNYEFYYSGNPGNMKFMRDEWGLDVYRIANGIEGYNGYLDEEVRPARLEDVEMLIQGAIEADVYALIDFHTHEIEHKDLAIEFFSYIAEKYGEYPHLIYEVFNEPIGPSEVQEFWQNELKPYHEELVAAIRLHDPDNVIVLGTPRWSQEVAVAAADPVAGENLLYTLHFYSCTHTSWLRDRAKNALDLGIGLFVTEWGSTHADGGTARNPGVCAAEAAAWHDFLDEHKIGSAAWKLSTDGDASAILLSGPAAGPWEDEHLSEHGMLVREFLQRP